MRDRLRPARLAAALVLLGLLDACTTPIKPELPALSPEAARAEIRTLLPPDVPDREGWAVDIAAAFEAIGLPATVPNACAVIAVADQESNFRTDPVIPDLPAIARREIDARARRAGVPLFAVHALLHLNSPDGRSYEARLDSARTERQLSEIYEDLIGQLPAGNWLLADHNPIRTAGPMQVSVSFAEDYARDHRYPYPVHRSLRHETFTRRGSVYFGIAHLLDYPADYDRVIYRFADYNAGRYASRNAAFQAALARVSGHRLQADGDLAVFDPPGQTERAARSLERRLELDDGDIRSALADSHSAAFAGSALYRRVFALADRAAAGAVPRAQIPEITLKSPKFSRHLTTAWYAGRVEGRYERCLQRGAPLPH